MASACFCPCPAYPAAQWSAPEDPDLLEREAELPEDAARPDDRVDDERHDEENRLKPEFVAAVRAALEAGDEDAVQDLVDPLHPADIADLFELVEPEDRVPLTAAIAERMTGEVIAELNDHVREGNDGGAAGGCRRLDRRGAGDRRRGPS